MDEFCRKEELKTISASTIGLIIKKNNMFWQPTYNLPLHNRYTKDRTRKMVKYSPKEQKPRVIIADVLTAVEAGVTRYFFDAVDVATKFGFSYYFNKQTSQNMVNFYEMFKKVFPFKIKKRQNDNGHENLGLFQQRLKQDGIKQVFSYQ